MEIRSVLLLYVFQHVRICHGQTATSIWEIKRREFITSDKIA